MKTVFRWIPSLYLLEGLFFSFITMTTMILYKNLNVSNTVIAFYSSLLTLPWFLKPLFSPLFESFSKRSLILFISCLLIILIFLLTIMLSSSHFFYMSIIILFVSALMASIFDMNVDGLYILKLEKKEQAHFIGIRTICYHLGRLIAQFGVVFLASLYFKNNEYIVGWQLSFVILTIFLIMLFIYHFMVIPKDQSLHLKNNNMINYFKSVIKVFITIPNLLHVILFTIFYNIAENQLIKIVPLFLLDHTTNGGLNLTTSEVSILIGVLGVCSMLVGILISGFLMTRMTIQKTLIPVSIFACLVNICYLLLSLTQTHFILFTSLTIVLTQFGYGLTNGIYMFYLLHTFGNHPLSMSLYAIGTALMGFSVILGGALSGYLQSLMGYPLFFSWIILNSILIIMYTYFLIKKNIIRNVL